MSEDIDFKIQKKESCFGLSKTRLLKELKQFRDRIIAEVKKTDFAFGEMRARNDGQYLETQLLYKPIFPQNIALRPHFSFFLFIEE